MECFRSSPTVANPKENNMNEPLMDVILGTALMVCATDNEEWGRLSDLLKLKYLHDAIESLLKAEKVVK